MELNPNAPIRNWELAWATYDEQTYLDVLAYIGPNDIVLDIGAGDFRLAKRIARRAHWVYAIEIKAKMAASAKKANHMNNLKIICGDAYQHPFPQGITLAVLLMRHCQQFRLILGKLTAVGCHRLLTNARWGMGVELLDLAAEPLPYNFVTLGWYSCRCGHIGFIEGPAEQLTFEAESLVHEVCNCPVC